MDKKVVPPKRGDNDDGGNGDMEAVLNRVTRFQPIRKSRSTAVSSHQTKCEMRVLMDFNSRVLRKNGFSKQDVARIIEEERAKNAKCCSRY